MTLKETIQWLSLKGINDKIKFTEMLLFDMTVMNRAFLDDPDISDKFKVESLKWSNELAHRIWHLLFELNKGVNLDYEDRLSENIKFYIKQSEELKRHLVPTIKITTSRFEKV